MLLRARRTAALVTTGLLCLVVGAAATPRLMRAFRTHYPETRGTRLDRCTTCHGRPPALNPYGADVREVRFHFPLAESLDSDKDGVSNIVEIRSLSRPGDPGDRPGVVRDTIPGAALDTIHKDPS